MISKDWLNDSGWQSTVFTREIDHSMIQVRGVIREEWQWEWTERPLGAGKIRNRGVEYSEQAAKRAAMRCARKIAREARRSK